MRSIRQTLSEPSVLSKTQQNHAVLLRTRFKTLWRNKSHINLKIDADALNRRWRRFCAGVQYNEGVIKFYTAMKPWNIRLSMKRPSRKGIAESRAETECLIQENHWLWITFLWC